MNTLSIANIDIRIIDGLYSLNDMHRASGNEERHKPFNWMRSKQTIEIIEEVEIAQKRAILKKQGLGTFVCKELAYHYAMWISAKFSLLVIRTFDEVMNKQTQSAKINEFQKQQIKDAVNKRHHRTEETHQAIYTKLHQFIGVNSYHEIPANRFQDALQFIGSTADTPSKPSNHITVHLPKGRNEWHITIDDFNGYQVMEATNAPYGSVLIGNDSMVRLAQGLHYVQRMRLLLEHLHPVLAHLASRHAGEARDLINTGATFGGLASFLSKNYRYMDNPQAIRNVEDVLMRTM